MEYFLKQVAPENPFPLLISLHEDEMKIGRSTVTSLSRYNRVSRYHATLTRRNDAWYLTDHKSLNCLYVNFKRVQQTVELNVGDIIGFGSPNVSEDGGFVCVLAARGKVTVKREPNDDEDCVEICQNAQPTNLNNQYPFRETMTKKTTSNVDSTPKGLLPVSSSTITCNSESSLEFQQNTITDRNVKDVSFPPTLVLPKLVTEIMNSPNRSIALNALSTIRELNHESNVLQEETINIKVEYDNEGSKRKVSLNNSNVNNCSPSTPTELPPTPKNTPSSSPSKVYPGIEYFEGHGEYRSSGSTVSDVNAKNIKIPNEMSGFVHSILKQECLDDFETNLSVNNKQQRNAELQEVDKLQSIITGEDGKQTQIKNEHLPKNCSNTTFNNIHPANDIQKTQSNCIQNVPSNNFSDASYCYTTNNFIMDNFGDSFDRSHLSKNLEEKNSYLKDYCEDLYSPRSVTLRNENKCHSDEQMDSKRGFINKDRRAKSSVISTSPDINHKKHSANNNSFPKMSLNCNIGSFENSLDNTEVYAKSEKLDSKIDKPTKKSSCLTNINSRDKIYSSSKKQAYDTKRNSLTVEVNLKVNNNKHVNSDSDCESKNEHVSPLPRFSDTDTRKPKRRHETHCAKFDSQRSKRRKIEDKNSGGKVSHSSSHSKRLDLCSDYSDKGSRTKPSPEKPNEISRNARSKSVGRTQRTDSCSDYSDKCSRSKPSTEKLSDIFRNARSRSVGRTTRTDSCYDYSDKSSRTKPSTEESNEIYRNTRSKSVGRTKRTDSCSDYTDKSFRTKPPTEESNEISRNTRSKSVGRTRRTDSCSDYIDKSFRTKPSTEESNKISRNTRSKSVGETKLIDSKPMEYRPKTHRRREEWFQERTSVSDVSHEDVFSMSSKHSEIVDEETKKHKKKKLKSCCKRKKEAESSKNRKSKKTCYQKKENKKKLKNQTKESKHLFQTSEAVHFQDKKEKHNKIDEEDSQKSTKLDRNKIKPPVPRRKNELCSRMGFLVDTQINCPKKSVETIKQKILKKPERAKIKENIAAESKIHLNLSLNVDVSEYKSAKTRSKNPVHQYSYKKNLTNSESSDSAAAVQHSTHTTKVHPEVPSYKVHGSEKWIPISETKYAENCKIDKCLTSNTSKKATNESRVKNINYLTNSERSTSFSHNPNFSTKGLTEYSLSTRNIDPFHASSMLLMEMIVGWNPKWLIEQSDNENPPPLIAQGASLLNLSFSSYESYASSYFSMIVLETWGFLCECNKYLLLDQLQNWTNLCYVVKSWENRRGFTELKCEAVVSDALCYWPTQGNILLMNLKDRQESGIENYRFGCIRCHSVEIFEQGAPEWDNIPAEALNNAKLVKFEVLIKKSRIPILSDTVCLAHGLSNVKHYLQIADALRALKHSPLCQDIYHPREDTLKFCDSSRPMLSSDNLVQAISEEVTNPHSKSNFLLLQAPSGTGKTRCVVELVQKLIFRDYHNSKVLVYTPSYIALDDILHKLIRSNEESGSSMKLVRIGEYEAIDSNLMEYSLTKKVEALYRDDCMKKMQVRENALKILEEKINEILFKQQKYDKFSKINRDTSLKALIEKMESMKNENLLYPLDEGCRKGYECIVLQECDVLFSVLDCSMLPAVRTFLKSAPMVYCLVDEAAQCNELKLLQCLQQEKISKLILFGDPHQQKPTVISKHAAKCGFDRSIFERFFFHYRKKFKKMPRPALMKQYRMHSEICQFPSKYFYNQEMSTAAGIDESYSLFPLKPYVVLDVLDSGSFYIDTESSLIMYICSVLIQACPEATIGVIVTGQESKQRLSLPWDPEYKLVELDTVEGFHGKEKDIILIPCIRQRTVPDGESLISCANMLNLAITRAKQCLIICGQIASKAEYAHWRALMDDAASRNCYLCLASLSHLPMVFSNYIKKV